MSRKAFRFVLSEPRLFPDRLFISVPWRRAAWLRDRLKERGISATVCYDPAERAAGLEFRPGTDRDAVHHALRDLGG